VQDLLRAGCSVAVSASAAAALHLQQKRAPCGDTATTAHSCVPMFETSKCPHVAMLLQHGICLRPTRASCTRWKCLWRSLFTDWHGHCSAAVAARPLTQSFAPLASDSSVPLASDYSAPQDSDCSSSCHTTLFMLSPSTSSMPLHTGGRATR
jgi:hypothetical protein